MTDKIAVAIPSYKVQNHVLEVIAQIPAFVSKIYVVDDKCPHGSSQLVQQECRDPRVQVIFHEENQGVGGAMITAYRAAWPMACPLSSKSTATGK